MSFTKRVACWRPIDTRQGEIDDMNICSCGPVNGRETRPKVRTYRHASKFAMNPSPTAVGKDVSASSCQPCAIMDAGHTSEYATDSHCKSCQVSSHWRSHLLGTPRLEIDRHRRVFRLFICRGASEALGNGAMEPARAPLTCQVPGSSRRHRRRRGNFTNKGRGEPGPGAFL